MFGCPLVVHTISKQKYTVHRRRRRKESIKRSQQDALSNPGTPFPWMGPKKSATEEK